MKQNETQQVEQQIERVDKVLSTLTIVFRLLILIGLIINLWQEHYQVSLVITGILFLTFLPRFLDSMLDVNIPIEFEFLTVIFMYLSLFLGEIAGFYQVYWWWDLMLHLFSGLIAGIFGFLLVFVLNENERIGMHLKPGFVAFFAFLFALGLGSLWELFEYAMDIFFGLNMTKTGLDDSMEDLFIAMLGGLFMALQGYYYLREPRGLGFLDRWIRRFIQANPDLFRPK